MNNLQTHSIRSYIIIIYSYIDSAKGHAVLLSVKYKETLLLERIRSYNEIS
jgi:hypothetical protein